MGEEKSGGRRTGARRHPFYGMSTASSPVCVRSSRSGVAITSTDRATARVEGALVSDFFQNGVVAVLHRLGPDNLHQLEADLRTYAETNPIALVLPSLFAELSRPALRHIVATLRDVPYLNEIVISLDRASPLEFRHAKEYFSVLPQRVRLIWNDGPGIQDILRRLESCAIDIGLPGKGRGCWMAFGYVLARGQSRVLALHDCDILSYSRHYLARLCYPIANPNMGYEFCKGYYSRITDRLHGRVTRLFFTPLVRSLQKLAGPQPLLTFLDSFRYPLAGEFAMVKDLAWINRIPGDWGLEVGVLSEIHRNCALRRVCQVDIADTYEHKHQDLSGGDPNAGLLKMCVDITKALFRNLASEGLVLSDGVLKTLQATYLQGAQEAIGRYEHDAAINSLRFDRHEERKAVEVFFHGMKLATESFQNDPLGVPMISNWSRVAAAVPDVFSRLIDVVENDHQWDPTAVMASVP